jgi:hypothetical protein
MEWIRQLLSKKPEPKQCDTDGINHNKDPMDYKKCSLSTDWDIDPHHCTKCQKSTSHREYISDVCNSCGSFDTQVLHGRSYRKIKEHGEWRYQVRYRNGVQEIMDTWY